MYSLISLSADKGLGSRNVLYNLSFCYVRTQIEIYPISSSTVVEDDNGEGELANESTPDSSRSITLAPSISHPVEHVSPLLSAATVNRWFYLAVFPQHRGSFAFKR